ncbi:hypothetical protein BSTP3_169 [Bacillus phage BSTP3]|nr:hypothetical protein BSTP3_169 [Bacillus phage BSTP3]
MNEHPLFKTFTEKPVYPLSLLYTILLDFLFLEPSL